MDYTQADVDSLAAKLAAADLTEAEQAVMDALVDAAEGEVAGFAQVHGEFWFTGLKPGTYARFDGEVAGLAIPATGIRKDITIE